MFKEKKGITGPQHGGAFRIAPMRDEIFTAAMWRFWNEGNDIYAISRGAASQQLKLSVHASGESSVRFNERGRWKLSPALKMGDWLHVCEVRFLINPDALPPPLAGKLKRNQKAHGVEFAPDKYLALNLFVGPPGVQWNDDAPALVGGKPLWICKLADGRTGVLVGRIIELDEANRNVIADLREKMQINVKADSKPGAKPPYVEARMHSWSPTNGNIIAIMPLHLGAFRQPRPTSMISSSDDIRRFTVNVPALGMNLAAPDRSTVARLIVTGGSAELSAHFDHDHIISLGQLRLELDLESLRFGEQFVMPLQLWDWMPTIDGVPFGQWRTGVYLRFDGAVMTVEFITAGGVNVRNKFLKQPLEGLANHEEILLTIPSDPLILKASKVSPHVVVDLKARFWFRSISSAAS